MKQSLRAAALAALLCAALATSHAQGQEPSARPEADATAPAVPSALDAQLFYQLLLGELSARGDEPTAGFALMLDAARRTDDPALYRRAVEMALQSRAGDLALQAAQAWRQAQPGSQEATRYSLQILLALNRVAESASLLKADIALADPKERSAAIAGIPRLYARVSDKPLAASLVEQVLTDDLKQPATATAAWTAVGRMRLAAGDNPGALQAARRAQAADPQAEGPALLALELMDPRLPQAEDVVRSYLAGNPLPELRMVYARALLDAQRYAEAQQQLQQVTAAKPDFAEAWLALGTLQAEDSQFAQADASLKRYLELVQERPAGERSRGSAQAYLALAQMAEKQRDYAGATAWLDKIDNPQDMVAAQLRRASLLARQGQMAQARALLRSLPERNAADARLKLSAEVQLLREHKKYRAAYDLLAQAIAKDPQDTDLLYDQSMLAEKLGDLPEMERLLRQVIALKPDYHHAYNALGYSLADRGLRLPEAKELIQKALEFAPGDPFITDSLGWVEFRMGHREEAARLLETAYRRRPDAEIAAHFGEVLWSLGQRDRALAVWREGLALNAENETLLETLKRLGAKP